MKTINELKQERASKIKQMADLLARIKSENRGKDDSETKLWEDLNKEVDALEENIKREEKQIELNQRIEGKVVEPETREVKKTFAERFMEAVKEAPRKGVQSLFIGPEDFQVRANPVLSTTDTGVINKSGLGVDVITSPGETFFRNLGVKIYEGLVGNFTLPSMGESRGYFVDESKDGSTANQASASVTLAARRITHSQAYTKEMLTQSNPGIYASFVQDLIDGIWTGIGYDFFTQFEGDAAAQVITHGVTTTTTLQTHLVDLEASLGGLQVGPCAYLMHPKTKSYLKKNIMYGTTSGPMIWTNNEVNGYPAFAHPAVPASGAVGNERIYFGDWSKAAIGSWGPLEVIVDPYGDNAKAGKITVTVIGLFDSGVQNKRAFSYLDDASTF